MKAWWNLEAPAAATPNLDSASRRRDDSRLMKSGFNAGTVGLIFAVVLVLYLVTFFGIEGARQAHGPWQVEFQPGETNPPTLVVSQTYLNVSGVKIVLHGERVTNAPGRVVFNRVKLPVPFGRVLYEDLTFLPGVVTFDLLGHEVEIMPRALVVNKKLLPWQPGMTVDLWPTNKPAEAPKPPKVKGR